MWKGFVQNGCDRMKGDVVCKHCDCDIYLKGLITDRFYCNCCNMFLENVEVMVVQ